MKVKIFSSLFLGILAALTVILLWYYDVYIDWQPKVYPFARATFAFGVAALTLFLLWVRGERKAWPFVWKTLLSTAVFAGLLFGLSYLINDVMYNEHKPALAISIALPLAVTQLLVLFALLLRALRKYVGRTVVALLTAILTVTVLFTGLFGFAVPWYIRNIYRASLPPELRDYAGEFAPMESLGKVDFTVSPNGMTIEEARDAIRELHRDPANADRRFTVLMEDGEYNIRQIRFDERDFNTTYRSRSGGVILNGGHSLNPGDFEPVSGKVAGRLSEKARENVVQIDLTALSLTADDWGKMYAFGAYTMAAKYDGGVGPLPCELFFNGRRQALARYPNGKTWLKTGKVIDNGDSRETYESGTMYHPAFDEIRNPRGGTFAMDKETAARTAKWATLDDVWMFGCFMWEWADMSTPVKAIDNATGTVTAEHASIYGYGRDKNYYFYNVLEELDAPGEWYLDRDVGILYLYPPEGDFGNARIDISLSTETLVTGENVRGLTFQGLTVQGTRGDGMNLTGDHITIDHCLFQSLAGSALTIDGYHNTVSNNEITHVGKRGISINGGDQVTLTPGDNRVVNNLIHDWPEVLMNYQGGINLNGTGNLAAHNELYNSPHTAIFFDGNNNVIEYNLIRDVCLLTQDAGAIYSHNRGYANTFGMVIRNNAIYNLGHLGGNGRGDRANTPDGIYLDGGNSGITMLNNLIVNVPKNGICINGGRENTAQGNVIVRCGIGIDYSASQVKALHPQWFEEGPGPNGRDPGPLAASPYQTALWRKTYPNLAKLHLDYDNMEDIDFGANPSYSVVTDNVVVGNNIVGMRTMRINDYVPRYSTIGPNDEYDLWKGRRYWELPEFEKIQPEKIGRMR